MRFRTAHVIGAAAIATALVAGVYRSAVHAAHFGEDLEIICAAGDVLEQRGNPYHLATLEAVSGLRGTFIGYPPLTALALRPVCGRVSPVVMIVAGVVLLLGLTTRLLATGVWPAGWAILSGLAGFPWLVLTGNLIGVLEGLCGVAAAWAIMRSRPIAFGVAIGLAAFLKVQPAAYLLAACVRWPARQAAGAAATAAAVFAALHLVTFASTPVAFGQYWAAVASGWDGLVHAELRFGSENNPSLFAFLPIATDHAGVGRGSGYALGALVAIAFAGLWLHRWRTMAASEAARIWMALLAMAVIALIYPRFKPYTIVFLLPALAMILARLRGTQLNVALAVACLLPNVALIGMTWLATGPPVPVPVVFALQYAQWVLIACALALSLTKPALGQLTRSHAD